MSTFPGSPKLIKGGLVLVDSLTGAVLCVIPLQVQPGHAVVEATDQLETAESLVTQAGLHPVLAARH